MLVSVEQGVGPIQAIGVPASPLGYPIHMEVGHSGWTEFQVGSDPWVTPVGFALHVQVGVICGRRGGGRNKGSDDDEPKVQHITGAQYWGGKVKKAIGWKESKTITEDDWKANKAAKEEQGQEEAKGKKQGRTRSRGSEDNDIGVSSSSGHGHKGIWVERTGKGYDIIHMPGRAPYNTPAGQVPKVDAWTVSRNPELEEHIWYVAKNSPDSRAQSAASKLLADTNIERSLERQRRGLDFLD